MSVQNPTIPTATQAKAIDSIILDLQTHLDTELVWLTNGMGRAYRLSKVRTDQTTVILPEVYLGVANRYDYFAATPDNDKQGQNIFFVGDATLPDQQKGFYGWVEHEVGIIFSANLKLIDSALLVTEDFTEHLIQDVREALIRDLVGKSYRLNIDSITRDFDDVYAEFDVQQERGIAHAPMTHFRVNCTITFKEDCAGVSLDRCNAILQNLSTDDKLNCILPTYDFSTTAVQDATTAQQQTDMIDWLCAAAGYENTHSIEFDGVNDYIEFPQTAEFDWTNTSNFTISVWIKPRVSHTGMIYSNHLTSGQFTGFQFRLNSGGELFMAMIGTSSPANLLRLTTVGTVSNSVWTHIAMTYDGSSDVSGVNVYINGVSQSLVTIDNSLSISFQTAEPYKIGVSQGIKQQLDGKMTEFRIWDVEQNAAFILDDYNSGSPKEAADKINSIALPRFGQGALWNDTYTNWRFADESNIDVSAFQTVGTIKAARNTDIPT
jgi:hypothetical protein